jgi:2-dehydropantoate 2-reductase
MSARAEWHILGAGAMGTLLAHRLSAAGVEVRLLHHEETGERRLVLDDREHRVPFTCLGEVPARGIRRLLLATKAPRLEEALRAALPHLAPEPVLLTIANGIGFARSLGAGMQRRGEGPDANREVPLHRAVTTAAAYRDAHGRIVCAAIGDSFVGTAAGAATPAGWFADSLARLADWSWDEAIEARVARKFAVNCVINPLTAVRRLRNGELLTEDTAYRELVELCEETEPVLRRLGLWPDAGGLLDTAKAICAQTARNRSSMLQDVLAGRETEIEFLTGELLRRADGDSLPINRRLYAAIAGQRRNGP